MNPDPHKTFEAACGHLKKNNLGIRFSDEKHRCFYPEDGERRFFEIEDESFWFIHRRNCIIEMVKNNPPEGFILDIGGGNGFVTAGLKDAGFDAVLMEPNWKAVANAYQRGIRQIICSTANDALLNTDSIPAIGLFDVLEHIQDDKTYLYLLKELLAINGKLYLTVPAFPFLWSAEDVYAEHFRRYTLRSVCNVLEETGFEIQYATYLFSYLPLPLFFLKSLPAKLGRTRIYTPEETWNEHRLPAGFRKWLIDWLHDRELRKIRQQKKISIGTSIMVSAHITSVLN